MDQGKYEESTQKVLDFKCTKIISGIEKSNVMSPTVVKSGIVGKQNLDVDIMSQTPEKTSEPLRAKCTDWEAKILEKHKTIVDLFDRMTCSLRLLGLSKKPPTFENICARMEVLMKRKFSHGDLARLKYILPEAIQIDKILIHDKKTLCMRPDLNITLLFDVIEGHQQKSDFIALQYVFAARLISFFVKHPEACDIPEAVLLEPFCQISQTTCEEKGILPVLPNQTNDSILQEQLFMDSLNKSMLTSNETETLSKSSLVHPSLSRFFSKKNFTVAEIENAKLPVSPGSLSSASLSIFQVEEFRDAGPKSDTVTEEVVESEQLNESPKECSKSISITSSIQLNSPLCFTNSNVCESTLQKVTSPSDCLVIQTPAQLTMRRSMPISDEKLKTVAGQTTSCYKPAKRSLDFSYLSSEKTALDLDESTASKVVNYATTEIMKPKSLCAEDIDSSTLQTEVETSAGFAVENCETSQSGLSVHLQMTSCLSDLVSLIHHIFQSVDCRPITREELVQKIIMNHIDIVDRREVEEQIELLEMLVPDWICRKLATSGDIMYNIKNFSDLSSIQARLISK